MAGKKKNKGALDDQHVKNINTNFDHYRKFPIAKEDYWRNIAKAKQPEADALWDRLLKKSEEEQAATAGAAAARAESRAQDDSIKSSTTASSLTHVKVSSSISAGSPTAVGVNTTKATITDTPASAMPGHDRIASDLVTGSWTTPAVGTQDVSPDEGYDEVHELVNKESTSRDMPDPVRGETRLSNGTVHKINEHNVRSFLSKVDPSTAIYPIRNGMLEQTTELFTNRYEVCIDEGATLHEFHIVGIPEGRSRRMTKMFVDTAIERSFVLNSNKHHFATDYMKKIISWKDLREDFKSQGAGDTQTNSWHLVDVKDDDRTVHIYLQHIRVVDTAGLRRYVASEPAGPGWDPMQWQEETTMEALNIVIAKCFDGNIVRAAPNKFFVEAGWQRLGNSPLCTIRGYYFSARPGMGSILLNVNACTSAFFLPVQLGELMRDSHHFGRDYPSVLTGLRVYISYERGRTDKAKSSTINEEHSRIKRICELGQACNRQTFKFMQHKEDGSFLSEDDITVADYLSQEYNITLRMPDLPAVNLGSWMRPCWFPPEELYIMPYQIYQRAVPTALTAAMLNTACHPPDHSAGLIEGEGMSRLLLNQNPKPPYVS
jgi:eukaryotic translation initiation factor 2C